MITEDYVSYETAKLLKEKGFNGVMSNREWYVIKPFSTGTIWNSINYNIGDTTSEYNKECCIPRPTIQMAMKWLRKTHNLFVFPFPQMNTNKFWVEIYQLSNNQEWVNIYCESIDLHDYPLYEEACEAAIKYCLENLI